MDHLFISPIPTEQDLQRTYNPWMQTVVNGGITKVKLIQQPMMDYLAEMGYLYDLPSNNWFKLDPESCTYSHVDEFCVENELLNALISTRPNRSLDISMQYVTTIIRYAKLRSSKILNELLKADGSLSYYLRDDLYITNNGVIDTVDGTIHPNCRYLFRPTRTLFVDYVPMTESEISSSPVMRIYDHIFDNEDNLNYYLWLIGQTFFSDRPAKAVTVMIGVSNSGKSALMLPVMKILGDRGIDLDIELFNSQFGSSLVKRGRLAVFNEADSNSSTDAKKLTSMFKRMTGGEKMVYNQKNVKMEVGQNTANIILMCNSYPDIYMPDPGLVKRLRVIHLCHDQNEYYGPNELHKSIVSDDAVNWLFNVAKLMWDRYGEDGNDVLSSKLSVSDKRDMLETSPFMKWAYNYAAATYLANSDADTEITFDDIHDVLVGKKRKIVYDNYKNFIQTCDEFSSTTPMSNQKFYDLVQNNFKLTTKKIHGYDIFR